MNELNYWTIYIIRTFRFKVIRQNTLYKISLTMYAHNDYLNYLFQNNTSNTPGKANF